MRFRSSVCGAVCVAAALGCLTLSGCGKASPFKLAPASGKVTLDGKGVPNLTVVFTPMRASQDALDAGVSSSAQTDATGAFELATQDINHQKGAVVGKHQVSISRASINDADPPADPVLDPIVADIIMTSSLSAEVPPGAAEDLVIELKKK